jgi:exopolyphosphatase / guanosine-5'-triphosphate,3'-diphosphate pyrophosphatase
MPVFAAIDIGANSVRLMISRLAQHRLHVLHEDREVTRLGESVFRAGLLSTDAMAHTVEVLQRFQRAVQKYGAESVRVVGTSPLRDARNTTAFTDWVGAATGWRVEVISGLEEGRLIHLAVVANTPARRGRALLLDLGGGSCEITLSEHGEIRQIFSLPLGAVRLTQEFLRRDPPKRKEIERLRSFIREELARIHRRLRPAQGAVPQITSVVATSGTAAALAGAFHRAGNAKDVRVPREGVRKLAASLSKLTRERRAAIPGIGTRRAEIIVAGANVFAELLTGLNLPGFRYSPLGLRDGLLAQMSADYDRGTQFRKQIDAERRNALVNTARHYAVDLKFAEHVCALALKLFSGMKALHRLPAEYEEWLAAAAMLQEVGSYVNRSGRRRHSYYIIVHSEIFGYTVHQRRLIAAIARFVGKSRPTPDSRALRLLSPAERNHLQKAVMLLRLARALNLGRRNSVKDVRVQAAGERVVLSITTDRSGADLEMWALQKERDYFREVFGRELDAVS